MGIITFTGKAGSGKSTAIEILKEISKKPVVNLKLAQPLYDIQEYIYNRVESAYKRSEFFKKDRWMLQTLGSGLRERLSDSIWLDLWKAEVDKALATDAIVVCDDVRYPNESLAVKELEGVVIEITSPYAYERGVQGGIANHSSEQGLPSHMIDFTIKNDSTVEVYRNRLIDLFTLELDLETK